MFAKSYLPNYTEEIFTIYERFARQVPVYKLKDDAGEILEGTFYEPELQKIIKNDDVYRVEKILRKRNRNGVVEYLVKWKGYADKFNSWVSERDNKRQLRIHEVIKCGHSTLLDPLYHLLCFCWEVGAVNLQRT